MKRLTGRVAVVTGGGSGIGASAALALAGEDCRVVIAGRNEGKLRATSAACAGPPMICHAADVTDRDDVARLFERVAEMGGAGILVNAAGVNVRNRALIDLAAAEWDRVLAVNATGAFNCLRAALPAMLAGGGGLIVNICSIAGLRADAVCGAAYIASKFAMSGLGAAAALEYGRRGIRVTTVCPGDVDTAMLDDRPRPPGPGERAGMLRPEDVAEVVLAVACLPPRAHVAEVVIKPTAEDFA